MEGIELTVLVERLVGYLNFILGGSLLLQRRLWMDWVRDIPKNPIFFPFAGMIGLLLGLFIVTVHDIWVWDFPVIVTVLGWIATIKGTFYLLAPQLILKLAPSENQMSLYCSLGGGGMILLSALILYGAYYYR